MSHLVPTQRSYQVVLPMRIASSKRKLDALNLNVYRNLHHRSLHAQKKNFSKAVKDLIKDVPFFEKVTLHYDIFTKTRRRLDIMNVGSIVDKYFSDVLVEEGKIPDDDLKHVLAISFGFGGMIKNEHVLVTVTETKERDPMKLSMTANLSTEDIQEAVAAWVTAETGQAVEASDVNLTEDGATVVVGEDVAETAPAKPKAKRRTKAQIAADKAKEEAANVEDTGTDSTAGDGSGTPEPAEEEAPDVEKAETAPKPEKAKADKKSKNLFGESPEESSTAESVEDDKTEDGTEETVKPSWKASIFDQ